MWDMNDIVSINYQDGYTFYVVFDNGVAGSIDLSEYTNKGPIFAPLKNKGFFRKATIEGGTISWPNGADIAPETLYEKINREQGVSPLLATGEYGRLGASLDRNISFNNLSSSFIALDLLCALCGFAVNNHISL